jgi:hypothetical protein
MKKPGLGARLKWWSTCLASSRPPAQPPVLSRKKEKLMKREDKYMLEYLG